MQKTVIGTWLHADTKGTESYYAQVGGDSSSASFQDIYWRCVCLFFASSKRHNPDVPHKLFTTVNHIPDIEEFATRTFLEQLGVEIVLVPFTYLPPVGFHGAWRNQFYILDIIKHLDAHCAADEQYVILDSDCIFTGSITALGKELERCGLLALDMLSPLDENINGITRRDMTQLFQALGQSCSAGPAVYYGGEFFAATAGAIHQLAEEIDPLWQLGLERFHAGSPKFNEEAHFLSFLYAKLGYGAPSANPFIRRIWTQRKHRTAARSDFDLIIWHVPAEKKYGLRKLFKEMAQPRSRFWSVPPGLEFAQYVAPFLGIPSSGLRKKTEDLLLAVGWRLQSRLPQRPGVRSKAQETRAGDTLAVKK